MRVVLVTPWDNAWVPMFQKEVTSRGHEFWLVKPVHGRPFDRINPQPDVVIHGWTAGGPVEGARNIMFLRRYELFDGALDRVDWNGIDHLVCVNAWIASVVKDVFASRGVKTPVSVIYNSVDTSKWKFRERKGNNKVGMACHVHAKKNLPLALQVMALLPDDYELHIAGEIQDPCTAEYLNHVGQAMRRKVYLYGHIERADLNVWWEQMGFCLSTSLSEGNPNNVLEAMAKGIKPIVHAWPGAEDQFPVLFSTAAQAADMIRSGPYESADYRAHVQEKFPLSNIAKVVDLALETECVS